MEILNVENLRFTYPKCEKPVINDVSFAVNEGEFIVLCGATGSGKSTLLKSLKPEITPLGNRQGCITVFGETLIKDDDIVLDKYDKKKKSPSLRIGYVCQNPKQQTVTDKVWHELAFGLENLNMPVDEMRIKVAEMASYFGIEDLFDRKTDELSGGQLQMINLASVMVMDPDILILDEPSAQLDPVAASEFFTTIKKLNEDFSLTVIIAEHRLEELIPVCDRMMVLKNGKIAKYGTPYDVLPAIDESDEVFDALPAAYRVYRGLTSKPDTTMIPLNIRDGRVLLRKVKGSKGEKALNDKPDLKNRGSKDMPGKHTDKALPALEFKDVSFRFTKEGADVLKDVSLNVNTGEIFCILGGNGSGKTTALGAAAGLLNPYEGHIKVFGKKLKEYKNQSLYNKCLSMLPQDVQTLFLHNSVREELESRHALEKLNDFPFDLNGLLDKHPYDLSGGEQQLVAMAIVLATEPKLILLDEPTKGLDAYRKRKMAEILKTLKEAGITIVAVTHDVEFAASCADRCALLFRGSITSTGEVHSFFGGNVFYTTSVCHMTKGICEGPVTVNELLNFLKDK